MDSGKGTKCLLTVDMDDLIREGLLIVDTGKENENGIEMQEREGDRTRPRSRVRTALFTSVLWL